MNADNWEKIEKIYDEALLIEAHHRLSFVESSTNGDESLFKPVMKMLEACNSENFMSDYPGKVNTNNIESGTPKQLGPFNILKKIATGGMGRVYLAQSSTADVPIKVALKTIRIELINKELKNKFHNEKTILSKLRHPNIASLIDAGVTEDNIPYIATEWINGITIKKYCEVNNLRLKKRLNLFIQVCQAVAFAHNKLIIHRDIKPDNVLVNQQEQVKLLDFGIAKIVDDNQNIQTATQIFTPDYAAPEQINGEMCTLATDIYSLGVVLFEMLTNSKRFDLASLSVKNKIKMVSTPTFISLDKTTSKNTLPYSRKRLKGTLSKIINKAMHVDPNRRYGSVLGLMDDIGNYLTNRPVIAVKDSYWYKFKMLVIRNKVSSTFILFALVSVLVGTILTIRQLNEKLIEVQKSQQVINFLIDSLQSSDPDITKGKNVSVIEFLQNAKVRIQETKFQDKKIASAMKSTIGDALSKVGEYNEAEKLLIQASRDDNDNLKSHIALANLYIKQKSFDLANSELNKLQSNEHTLSLDEKIQLQQLAAKLLLKQGKFEQAIHKIKSTFSTQINQSQLIESKLILATILYEYDHVKQSNKILRDTLKLSQATYGEQSTKTTSILDQLARNLSNSSPVPWDEVFKLYQKSLTNQIKIYGEFHPIVAKTLLNEGFAYKFIGNLDQAILNAQQARKIALRNFGESHILTAHIDLLWSQISFTQGHLNKAIEQLEKVLKVYEQYYGKNHFTTNQARTTFSAYLIKAKQGEKALANLLPLYQSQKEQLGENHKATLYVMLNLIKAYNLLNKYDKSVIEGTKALSKAKQHIGAENIVTLGLQMELAQTFINANTPKKALKLCNELLKYKFIKENKIYKEKVLSIVNQAKSIVNPAK